MGKIVLPAAVLAFAAVGLMLAWWLLRRWWRRTSGPQESSPIWSLQQLRELKADGQLTDEEYARLRARMIASSDPREP